MAAFVVFLIALVLGGVSVWLMLRVSRRDRQEQILGRLGADRDQQALGPAAGVRESALHNPIVRWASYWIWRIGYETADPVMVGRGLLIGAALIPLLLLAFGPFGGTVLVAVILSFGYLIVVRRAARRRMLILSQLPDFLEVAMRVLSAGNTLEESLAIAARESPEPIKPLFMSIGRQLRFGASIEEVIAQAAEIHRIRDLKVLALAASVNRKYGGSLRNIIRSLIQAIRTRETATRELRALTAETRFSALVLAVLPVGLTLYILLRNPGYYAQIWASTGGKAVLGLSVVLQVAGVYVLWRMLRATEDPA